MAHPLVTALRLLATYFTAGKMVGIKQSSTCDRLSLGPKRWPSSLVQAGFTTFPSGAPIPLFFQKAKLTL